MNTIADEHAAIEEVNRTLELVDRVGPGLSADDRTMLNKMTQKNVLVSLYSIWEQAVKNIVYGSYEANGGLIYCSSFIAHYIDGAFSKRYTKEMLLSQILGGSACIQKEILCDSNNVSFQVANELFRKIGFSSDDFSSFFAKEWYLETLNHCCRELIDNGVIAVTKRSSPSIMEKASSYIELLVKCRNQYSHDHRVTEIYSLDALRGLTRFVGILIEVLEMYKAQQLFLLASRLERDCESLISYPIKKMIRAGNKTGKTAIVEVGLRDPNCLITKSDEWVVFGSMQNNFPAKIISIRNEQGNQVTRKMLSPGSYTFELYSGRAIRESKHDLLLWCIIEDKEHNGRCFIQ